MGERPSEDYTTAHHLWLGKLLGEYHIMLAVFVCLWSQLMAGYLEPLYGPYVYYSVRNNVRTECTNEWLHCFSLFPD